MKQTDHFSQSIDYIITLCVCLLNKWPKLFELCPLFNNDLEKWRKSLGIFSDRIYKIIIGGELSTHLQLLMEKWQYSLGIFITDKKKQLGVPNSSILIVYNNLEKWQKKV